MFEVYYSLGGLYIYMEDYPSSADAYESFLEVWKGHPAYIRRAQNRLKQVYPILGDAYASEGNLSGAETAYRRLESLGGSSPQVYNNLAIIHRRMGNRPAAPRLLPQGDSNGFQFRPGLFHARGSTRGRW